MNLGACILDAFSQQSLQCPQMYAKPLPSINSPATNTRQTGIAKL